MAQERRVLLANGQYITIVQTTGTSSGDVMSQSAVTAALSTKSDIGHTHNASSITGGTFGTAMIADGAVTLAKLGSDVPISTTSYETIRVLGLTSGGTAAIGAEVTIGGFTCKFDKTGAVSVLIPYGQVYKIQAYSNDAWLGGYGATFTANTPSRSVSIIYNEIAINGVFIEATDGMLYTSNNWNSSKTPNSIVVAGDSVRFRIALSQSSSTMKIHSNYTDALEQYMTGVSSSATALSDYNGAGNTANIMKLQPSSDYAAGYCNAFTFPNDSTKGFLPSLGQLNLAYQNKAAVSTALSACGGAAMNADRYWSSTFCGVNGSFRSCWGFIWSGGSVYSDGLSSLYYKSYVRPFAAY